MIFEIFVKLFINIIKDAKVMNVIKINVMKVVFSFFAQIKECLKINDITLNVFIL